MSIGFHPKAGRNFSGRICVRHRGGGIKRRYRYIDYFKRLNSWGYIIKFFRKSFSSSIFTLIIFEIGLAAFIPTVYGLGKGIKLFSGIPPETIKPFNGFSLPLSYLKLFDRINNMELFPYSGAKICRAGGVSAIIIAQTNGIYTMKLNSGWKLFLNEYCFAILGRVSNIYHISVDLGKAGRSRALGIRPTVRGVIMNPCDHPHGGGEGRGSPPSAQKSPWGWFTKGTSSKRTKIFRDRKKLYKENI